MPEEATHERRLACPIAAEQREDRSARNHKGDMFAGSLAAVSDCKIINCNDNIIFGHLPTPVGVRPRLCHASSTSPTASAPVAPMVAARLT